MKKLRLATLDPRVKLLMLIVVSSLALFIPSPLKLVAIAALTLISLLLGGVEYRRLLKQVSAMMGTAAMIFVLQCLFRRDGIPLIILGNFTLLTQSGLLAGAQIAFRLLIIICAALIMLTGQIRDYLLALAWCRLPYEIIYMILAALRFIPILREEAQDVYYASQMRGVDMKNSTWGQRGKQYIAMLLPITASALHRAEQTAIAMEARGFRALPQRTPWRSLCWTQRDTCYACAFCLLLAVIILMIP